MAETRTSDAVSRLSWALRRYLGLVVGLALATAIAVTVVAPPAPADEYETTALVVAQRLDGVRAEHLPRMAEAIFSGNSVARRTVAETELEIRPEELVPDHARVEVVAGTVVMRVVGVSVDPRLAADIANEAAAALVDELGRLGPGVGTFALQESAPVPQDPAPRPLRIPPSLLGLLGGAVLGVGAAGLLLVLRRPVIDVDAAIELVDGPLLGVLDLSRAGHFDDPEDVAGSVPLADELYPRRREIQVMAATSNAHVRSQVSVLLTRVLTTFGPVLLVAARDRAGQRAARFLRAVPGVRLLTDRGDGSPSDPPTAIDPIPVVVDSRPSTRLTLPTSVLPVLVVAEGVPEERLRRAVNHLRPQQAQGVVWVASRGGVARGLVRRLLAGPPRERIGGPVPADETVSAPADHDEPAAAAPREAPGTVGPSSTTPSWSAAADADDEAARRAGP